MPGPGPGPDLTPSTPAAAQTAAHRSSGSAAPIVIVGAGVSGLVAANLLERSGLGLDVMLLDARARIGGRVFGLDTADGLHRFDLGPAWVWPQANPRLASWLHSLGLHVFEQHTRGATLVELPSNAVQRHATGFAQQPPSMRVVGGLSALTDALRARLQRTQLVLGAQVRSLQLQPDGGVGLEVERAEQVTTLTASSVVLAMPPRLLASGLRWSPPLPGALQQRWADAPTWMAGHAKLLAVYATPFWRAAGLSGSAFSQAGPLAEVHDASDAEGRHAAVFGFVGVPAPMRRRVGRQALINAALAQLARLFGPEALLPQSVQLQDWADEAGTATPADALPVSAHPDPVSVALPAPWRGCIALAGSEFAPDFAGYLEGAVRAAEHAVQVLHTRRRDA